MLNRVVSAPFKTTSPTLQRLLANSTTITRSRPFPKMESSSGNVSFGPMCSGTLMRELLRDKPEQVAKITKFETSFSQTHHFTLCPLPCKDLATVHTFITSMSALQELSVISYEQDGSALWPAILHHAASLRSLSIHTPPLVLKEHPKTWTAETISTLASSLPNLKHLELDIPLAEAESFLAFLGLGRIAASASSPTIPPIIDAILTHLGHLESIQITIPLLDEASSFADEQIWDMYGCKYFPPPQRQICERMAVALLDRFPTSANLKNLKLRLSRRIWDDRAQFDTYAYDTAAVRGEGGNIAVQAEQRWGRYLPIHPTNMEDGLWCRLVEEYKKESGRV